MCIRRCILHFIVFLILFLGQKTSAQAMTPTSGRKPATFWSVQSVDTMKYSRDASRQKLTQQQIETEVKNIADLGATHVAIGTPYNDEFIPRMKQWVAAARKYRLKVWFRGNWCEWEGWFGFKKEMTRQQHLEKTVAFITNSPELFEDGDIFTACPECENGAAGDPRKKDLAGFREFMIKEKQAVDGAFKKLNKTLITNYNSMNGDVAKLVMDKETTQKMGGVVSIDHYVRTPQKLVDDAAAIAQRSGGKIILGEVGAPIPDIHGTLTETQQAAWMEELFSKLVTHPEIIGINYWVDKGGSTQIWNEDGTERKAASVLKTYFRPAYIQGTVATVWGRPLAHATVFSSSGAQTITTAYGGFSLPYIPGTPVSLTVTAPTFVAKTYVNKTPDTSEQILIQLSRTNETIFTLISDVWTHFWSNLWRP